MSDGGSSWFNRKPASPSRSKQTQQNAGKPRPRRSGIMALEPRMMYDGAAAATAATAAHQHVAHQDGAHDGGADHALGAAAAGRPQDQTPNVQTPFYAPAQSPVQTAFFAPAQSSVQTSSPGAVSGNDRQSHNVATAGEPGAEVVIAVKNPTEIVFIDAQVPDAAILAKGAKPGVEVVMLDANSDGVKQIADFLSRHPDPNLTTVDIVAHGADGVLQLGSTLLSSSTMTYYQSQLASIGNAMHRDGIIQIFGCDVAQDMSGDLFLAQLSQATGGKNIDASSHLVGAAALGGSWTLNVQLSGGNGGATSAANPFTDATLASYADVLPDTIFLAENGNPSDVPTLGADYRVQAYNTATNTASTVFADTSPETPISQPVSIAVDAAHGVYYLVDNNFGGQQSIEIGKINGTAFADGNKIDTIFTAPSTDLLSGLALDPVNNVLYFGQGGTVETSNDVTGTGIFRLNLSGLSLTNPSSLSETQVVTGTGLNTPKQLALDVANQNIYFIDDSEGFMLPGLNSGKASNAIFEAHLPSPTSGAQTVANANMVYSLDATTYSQGFLSGIALDQADGKLFFTTVSAVGTGGAVVASENAILSATVHGGSPLTNVTVLYDGTNSALLNTNFAQLNIGLDLNNGASSGQIFVDLGTVGSSSLVQGSTGGHASSGLSTVFTPSFQEPGSIANNLYVDASAVVTASGSTVTYSEGSSAVTIDGALTVTTPSNPGELLSGATVSIGTNFDANHDHLNFTDQNGITHAYNATTGVLTLTGIATSANYAAALDSITFSTDSASAAQRTVNFTVTDGVVTSNTGTDHVNVQVPPTIANVGNTVQFYQSVGTPQLLDGAITVNDANGANITSASVTIGSALTGDTLTINGTTSGTIGAIQYSLSGATLSLTGSDTAAHYAAALDLVKYSFSGDPTGAGTDRVRSIAWSVTDADGLTSVSGASTTLDVFATPVVVIGTNSPTPTVTSSSGPVLADPGLSITDNNGTSFGASATNATVTISSGFQTGDTLTINGLTTGTINDGASGTISYSFTGGKLTLSGADTVADYITALREVKFDATSPNSGARTLTWQVDDEAGGHTNSSVAVTSTVDAAFGPQVSAVTALSGTEGAALSATVATFTDAATPGATASDFTATIDWGDGTPATTGTVVAQVGGGFAVTGAHTYAEEGSFSPVVTVTDMNSHNGQATDSAVIADAQLTPGTVTVSGGVEGTTAATLTATFTDANTGAPTSDFSGTINWGDNTSTSFTGSDVTANGNGSFTVNGFSHVYAEDGQHSVSVVINDKGGSTTTDTGTTTVADAPLTPGTVTVSGGVEGTTAATLTATFTDANTGAPTSDFSGTINWGDGASTNFTNADVTANGGGSFTVNGLSHVYAEEGQHNVSVVINDTGGSTTTDTGTTTVADAPLTPGTVTVSGGVEGTTAATLTATFTDANLNAPASDFSGTINWGDGTSTNFTGSDVTANGGGSFTVNGLSHVYAEEGQHNVSVEINDTGGSTTTDAGTTTVADAPLTPGTVTVSGGVEGTTAATLTATFSDGNTGAPASDFSGTINWGDGTSANFTSADVTANGNGSFMVNGFSHVYADDGQHSVSVVINDKGGSTTTDTGTTTVADAPLTPGTVTVSGGVEGTTAATLTATFTDANLNAPSSDFSGTINWGDNTSTSFTGSDVTANGNGSFTVNGFSHVYAEDGQHSVSVVINDKGGSTTTDTGTTTIADAPLTPGTVTVSGGVEGTTAAALTATFTDANTGAPTSDFSGTINWGDNTSTSFTGGDVTANGNGSFTVNGFSHVYAEDGQHSVSVVINDKGGSTTMDTGTTTVADAPLTPGTVTVSGGVEGTTAAALTATFTDANTGAPTSDFSGTINWGDGTSTNFAKGDVTANGGGSFTVSGLSHVYAEDGQHSVSVVINDTGGSTTTDTGTTTVADAPLTATGSAPVTGVEGAPLTATLATFTDANPNATVNDFTATITWGDGTTSTGTVVAKVGGGFAVTGTHAYAEEGSYAPVVNIVDHGGSTAQATDVATIADAPLTATGGPADHGTQGTALATTVATFTDANPHATASDFTATIDWGDGTTSTGTVVAEVGGGFAVTGAHSYAVSGVYKANVSIVDDGGSTAAASLELDVVPAAPAIATVIGQPFANQTIELKGTGEPGDIVKLFADGDNSTVVGTGTVRADGTFDITTTATFNAGPHVFTAIQTDPAGLTSVTSSPGFLVNTGSPLHMFTDNSTTLLPGPTQVSFTLDVGSHGPLIAPGSGGEGFVGGSGLGFTIVHTDPVLTASDDAAVQIKLALVSLEAPLGGDVAYVVARQANGDPLPDWLKFDAATGTFAGLPPDGAVASLEPDRSSDNNIVTGTLPPHPDLDGGPGAHAPALSNTITIEVVAHDSKGNIAVTVFTIDLRSRAAGKQGWNMDWQAPGLRHAHHAALPLSPELAAIEAAVRDVTRPLEPFASRGAAVGHGHDAISAGAGDSVPAGRAGLSEQLASIGWRSMAAQRDALLASLQGR